MIPYQVILLVLLVISNTFVASQVLHDLRVESVERTWWERLSARLGFGVWLGLLTASYGVLASVYDTWGHKGFLGSPLVLLESLVVSILLLFSVLAIASYMIPIAVADVGYRLYVDKKRSSLVEVLLTTIRIFSIGGRSSLICQISAGYGSDCW